MAAPPFSFHNFPGDVASAAATGWPMMAAIMRVRSVPLALVVLVAVAVAGCVGGADTPATRATTQTVSIPARWATANAASARTLTRTSDHVFVGTVVRQTGQETLDARSMGLAADPDAGRTLPLSLFEVRVDESIYGGLSTGELVVMEQLGGIHTREDGSHVLVVLEGDELLAEGVQYLFFADDSKTAPGRIGSSPFGRMKVTGGGLEAAARWRGLGAMQELAEGGVESARAAGEDGGAGR